MLKLALSAADDMVFLFLWSWLFAVLDAHSLT